MVAQEKITIGKIVIDAGHGGKDPGTIGKMSQEKSVTLAIALCLGKKIQEELPGVKVIYTRNKDEFVELHERAAIANRSKADLFISIHCNANHSKALHGAETYIMGLYRTNANLAIAKKENSSILMEPDYTANYDGFDPNSDESYITFSLFQNAFMDQSTALAALVQDEMKDRVGLQDRGVRQAGFLVLYHTTMPSILVETGFLSNPEEEKFLNSKSGQDYVSSAILRAIRRFRSGINKKTEEVAVKTKDLPSKKRDVTVKSNDLPLKKQDITVKSKDLPSKKQERSVKSKDDPPVIRYRVQVATFPSDIGIHSKRFAGLNDVKVYKHNGIYKYTSGDEKSWDDALKLLGKIKKHGFHDAFIVAFSNDERITVEEARNALGKETKK
ncbi:MAG: N-acetylmuramoyl-L-alanine amidase [Bacteroidota bacterium]|nr:N-acetylmuramoyl-L-alanine amidase [Bacteroidota bacterium]